MKTMCVIAGYFRFPLNALTEEQIENFKTTLTYTAPFLDENGGIKTIYLYRVTDEYLDLPVEWVKANYPTLYGMASDARVATGELKAEKLPSANHPRVKDPEAQAEFMQSMLTEVKNNNNVLAFAPTGSGKTVVSLWTAAQLGLRTLVLVHTEQLRDQWIEEIIAKLGISRERIGILQRDKCEIEGKDIVIGLLQTQKRREYSDDVYNAFGTIIVDECHKLSTEYFSDVLPLFNAKYRIGLSATPTRKDGADIVLYSHFGPVRVRARTKIMPLKVYPKKYYAKRKLWGKDERTRISCLVKDVDRNAMMAKDLYDLYKSGRRIVAFSHSVKHLEEIMEICKQLGMPEYDMGLLSANRTKYDAQGWNKIGMRRSTKQEIADAKKVRVCFMVDMFKEGIDVPEWDFLYELAPFWNANQRCGRVRRYMEGKLYPKCITIRDMKCEFSEKMWTSRLKDYIDCGAEIVSG